MTGDRYTLPAGILNSVVSVTHSSFGFAAWKSRFTRLAGAPRRGREIRQAHARRQIRRVITPEILRKLVEGLR